MNAYHRNDRLILANVVNFERDVRQRERRRAWRAALAHVALWLGAATVLGAALYYVAVGVVVVTQ